MSKQSIAEQISNAITQGKGAGELLQQVLDYFAAQSGTIHRLDEVTGELKLVAQIGVPAPVLNKVLVIPIGKGIAGLAALERRPITICNIQTDSSGVVGAKARLTGMEGAIAVPMLIEGKLHGTLGIGKDTEHTWSDAETHELQHVAALIGALIKDPIVADVVSYENG